MAQARTWSPGDYKGTVTGTGAAKLAASAVAPLIAAARGYRTVHTAEDAKKLIPAGSASHPERRRSPLAALLDADGSDILVLPWHSLSDVATAEAAGTAPTSRLTQIRPSHPRTAPGGRTRKYEFLTGQTTVIDAHPATPAEWIHAAPAVLLTEGVIKADSALTAILETTHGPSALTLPDNMGTDGARAALAALMRSAPEAGRILTLAVGGVSNWHKNPEWNSIDLGDRQALLAFDGDMRANPAVNREARNLFAYLADTKHAIPRLIDLGSPAATAAATSAGLPAGQKAGLDDWLAAVGGWDTIPAITTAALPEPPTPAGNPGTGQDARTGSMRMDPDRDWACQELVRGEGGEGPYWRDWSSDQGIHLAGRIAEVRTSRMPDPEERRTGLIDADLDADNATGTVRIQLTTARGRDGADRAEHTITGPIGMLAETPSTWSKGGARIDAGLLLTGAWPPDDGAPGRGRKWLGALVNNRREETRVIRAWDAMGWVPDGDGWAAFITGNAVIARTGAHPAVEPGRPAFGGAHDFGTADVYPALGHTAWAAQFADDARLIADAYVDNGPWADPAFGVLALAAMLRPTMPTPTSTVVFCSGPPNTGKSHWSSFVMSGWQERGRTWTGDRLPGSASDTMAAMEDCIARVPVWVVDDLAPDPSRSKQEARESNIAYSVRSVHNHSTRNRMDGATGAQRIIPDPMALLIITAENALDSHSANQRAICLPFARGAFTEDTGRTRRAIQVRDTDQPPAARLTGGMIRYWVEPSMPASTLPDDWEGRVEEAELKIETARMQTRTALAERCGYGSGAVDRQVKKIADMVAPLMCLREALTACGVGDDDPLMRKLSWDEREGWMSMLLRFAVDGIADADAGAPGRALTTALSELLYSQQAHVDDPARPGQPPLQGGSGADPDGITAELAAASALGWRNDPRTGTWVPCGARVGSLITRADGTAVIYFATQAAFKAAQSAYPNLLPPGQKQGATWASVRAEGLAADMPGRARAGTARVAGIPVRLDAILGEAAPAAQPGHDTVGSFDVEGAPWRS